MWRESSEFSSKMLRATTLMILSTIKAKKIDAFASRSTADKGNCESKHASRSKRKKQTRTISARLYRVNKLNDEQNGCVNLQKISRSKCSTSGAFLSLNSYKNIFSSLAGRVAREIVRVCDIFKINID